MVANGSQSTLHWYFNSRYQPEADILKMGILVCVPLPSFRDPTSQSKMSGLEIFPHPTCEVKGSGDCEFLHPISHMASEKWEVGLKREFPFLKYPTQQWHWNPKG